jgi:hypothetical protein
LNHLFFDQTHGALFTEIETCPEKMIPRARFTSFDLNFRVTPGA